VDAKVSTSTVFFRESNLKKGYSDSPPWIYWCGVLIFMYEKGAFSLTPENLILTGLVND